MFKRIPLVVATLLIAVVTAGLLAACTSDDDEPEPAAAAAAAVAMEKEGDAMAKDATAMEKKEGDAMAKDPTAMEKKESEQASSGGSYGGDSYGSDSDAMAMTKELPDHIRASHFVDSYPMHGDSLTQSPAEVVINVNFNLNENSRINVTRDGEPVAVGSAMIAEDQLSMRASLQDPTADGVYEVKYRACWPDGSCHNGSYAFFVDSSAIGAYTDLRGQSEVTIKMVDGVRFDAAQIIISPGTKVTWVNEDATVHFVNTDPHPSHNVLPDLNSTAMREGDTFSYSFDKAGAWGYHCSAHQNLGMVAQVVVQ